MLANKTKPSGIFLFLSTKGELLKTPSNDDYQFIITVDVLSRFLKSSEYKSDEYLANSFVVARDAIVVCISVSEKLKDLHLDEFIYKSWIISSGSIPGVELPEDYCSERYLGEIIVKEYFSKLKDKLFYRNSTKEIIDDLHLIKKLIKDSIGNYAAD